MITTAAVESRRPRTQARSGPRIGSLHAVGLEGHEGIGVLREAACHGGGQGQVAGLLPENGLGQLEVKGRGIPGQIGVGFGRLSLAREAVGQLAQHQLSGGAGAQAEGQQGNEQHAGEASSLGEKGRRG